MKLHQNRKLFSETLRATSQELNIKLEFVEKDYWISLLLNHLAESKYVSEVVFKGGTSLSKGYNLIHRFSEDVDLAIVNKENKSGNQIKTIIRHVEKVLTNDFLEQFIEGVTSKGSKYRKTVFEYDSIIKENLSNKLILEINAFANSVPFQKITINSLVFDFLKSTGNEHHIEHYNLNPFSVNVLNKEQTLIEKLISLIRFSYDEEHIERLSSKVRHFYDIYFMVKEPDCKQMLSSGIFKKQFNYLLEQDRNIFDTPSGWNKKTLKDSPLINNFDETWRKLEPIYQIELSAYAYKSIPEGNKIAQTFKSIIQVVQ